MTPKTKPIYVEPKSATIYRLHVDGPISHESEEFHEHFQVMRQARETDEVHIHINSGGGAIATAMQYVNIMSTCKAPITAHLEGECCSAATLIFLAASSWVVHPDSMFMVHNYTAWTGGVGDEGIEHAKAIKRMVNALSTRYYTGFLTKEEIEGVMQNNQTIWLSGDDVIQRIGLYAEYQQSLDTQELQRQQIDAVLDSLADVIKIPEVAEKLARLGYEKVDNSAC